MPLYIRKCMKRIVCSALFVMLLALSVNAQSQVKVGPVSGGTTQEWTAQDMVNMEIFDRVYAEVGWLEKLPMPDLVVAIAQQFLETPYVGHSLEKTPEELHVYLDQTDCILFVELCSSFALTVKGLRIVQAGDGVVFGVNKKPSVEPAKPSYKLLCENIRNMRYRLGKVAGYASRIHYTSEWILQNQTNGIVHEISDELGEEYEQKFYFMSEHPKLYFQLEDPEQLKQIRDVEEHLNEQAPYFYISQERLHDRDVMNQIQSGDIVCFMSKQGNGIDIAHVAIAFAVDGEMHFIHASYGAKKVKVEEQTLAEYAVNGIRLVRFNEELNK